MCSVAGKSFGSKGFGTLTGLNSMGLFTLKKAFVDFGKKSPNCANISSQLDNSSGCFMFASKFV